MEMGSRVGGGEGEGMGRAAISTSVCRACTESNRL